MNAVRVIAKEIVGLFVDDGLLAASVLVLVGIVMVLVKVFAVPPLAAGILLLFGCVGVLRASILRTAAAR